MKVGSKMADGGGCWLCTATGHTQACISANREVKQREATIQSGEQIQKQEACQQSAKDPDLQRNEELSCCSDCVGQKDLSSDPQTFTKT